MCACAWFQRIPVGDSLLGVRGEPFPKRIVFKLDLTNWNVFHDLVVPYRDCHLTEMEFVELDVELKHLSVCVCVMQA